MRNLNPLKVKKSPVLNSKAQGKVDPKKAKPVQLGVDPKQKLRQSNIVVHVPKMKPSFQSPVVGGKKIPTAVLNLNESSPKELKQA